ncbi:MAG: tetratricopeptide repeat protein [Bdellovibrionales bacterium]|nr:tetratricopeptide repeat protein [Bdellovibrionales bacterium]
MKVKSKTIFRIPKIHPALAVCFALCSLSAHADELKILSNIPDSSVFEVKSAPGSNAPSTNADEEEKTLLGKTPHTISDASSSDVRVIKVEKPGYTPVYLPLFGHFRGITVIRVSMKKITDWMPEDSQKKSQDLAERIVDEIFAVQTLLDAKQSKQALGLAETLHAKYPGSVAANLVYANALLLNGDFGRARGMYIGALDQIPDSRKQLKTTLARVLTKLSGQKPVPDALGTAATARMPASTVLKPGVRKKGAKK